MDDTRTRDMLDSLADLFLTQAGPSTARRPSPLDAVEIDAEQRDQATSNIKPRVAQPVAWRPAEQAAEAAHQMNEVEPALRLADASPPQLRSRDQARSRGLAPRGDGAPITEAVLLGNLPGFAGPWLAQYGQFLAEQSASVAVVHLDHEQIDVEYLRAVDAASTDRDESADDGDAADPFITPPPDAGPAELLSHLIDSPHSRAGRLLLHLAGGDSEQLSPLERRVLEVSDTWTIVTGADDAAIVSAYQTLKRLLRQAARRPRSIGLMVMGSDPAIAQRVVTNLDTTARSFLGLPIKLAGVRQRMEPVNVRFLGSFVLDGQNRDAMMRTLAGLAGPQAEPQTVEAASSQDEAAHNGEPSSTASPSASVSAPRIPTAADATSPHPTDRQPNAIPDPAAAGAPRPFAPFVALRPTPQEPASTSTSSAFPKDEMAPARTLDRPRDAADPLADRSPSLVGWLRGSVPLEARCPEEPAVELALDEDGRLHVLAQCIVADQGEAAAAGELARAAMSLLAARQWVRRHFELLALTQRQCRFDPAARPMMHLFTDHGPLASRLSQRVGQTLHVHLLSPPSHSRQGWHSFALA